MRRLEPPTGHVFRRDGARRSTWYAKYRLPDGAGSPKPRADGGMR